MVTAVRGEPSTWYSEGAQNNPGTSTVLASTGAIATTGDYQVTIIIAADATAVIAFQHRNAADNGNVSNREQRFYVSASSPVALTFHVRIDIANQRFRIIPTTALTGNASASIVLQKVN